MPIRITLRTNRDFSPFREMLHRLITLPDADDLILCSGYIWEPGETDKYPNYKILDDGLLTVLQRGCMDKKIVTIAGKLDERWLNFYKNFIRRLRQVGLQVTPYFAPKRNWHAKVAIRLKNGIPVAGIVGSSNLTGPAYGEDRRNWNFESDVLIWNNYPTIDTYLSRPFETDLPFGDIQLVLNPDISQPTEEEQLKRIHANTIENDFDILEIE